jgi:hypothetical protein
MFEVKEKMLTNRDNVHENEKKNRISVKIAILVTASEHLNIL